MTEPAKRNVSLSLPAAVMLPALIITFTLFNGLYNSLAVAFGYGFPFNTFCFLPQDVFADFIKSALSFPGPALQHFSTWPELYRSYYEANQYGGVAALAAGRLTNLHGMPLPTLILLEVRRALAVQNPNFVIFSCFTVLISSFCALVWIECRKSPAGVVTILAFLLSYPMIMAVTRGNVTAVMLGETLIPAILLCWRKENLWLVALFLALAINLRPNAVIFLALPLLRWSFREAVACGVVTLALAGTILWGSLALAHNFYPDYTLHNFYRALLIYQKIYAIGDGGLAYGSSLLGALKFLNIICGNAISTERLEFGSSLLGFACVFIWLILTLRRQFDPMAGIFTLVAIYALFSGVFGDYHLIVFFAFVLIYVREGINPFAMEASCHSWVALAALAMLIPKNYLFMLGLSAQILLNPLILAGAALAVTLPALANQGRPREEGVMP